ncbi:MAG TPA: class I SAM-dependent RNA methyltransferase [Chloroflexia bacterium]|nr:class I SAM-dependent RNA methyltransferase [Chloroflexia bacterium]
MSHPPEPGRGPTPAVGDTVHLDLTDMAYGGEAVGHHAGGVVFAWGGIAGERVAAHVDRVKRDLAWATVTTVAEPAPQRVAPPCPYFGPCGGCQWQQISYPGQLAFKTHILREQLRRGSGIAAAQLDTIVGPAVGMDEPWHYRNVAHFQVDPGSRKLGYFRRNSHEVVPIAVCPISDPGINQLLVPLQQLFEEQAQLPGDLPANLAAIDLEAVRRGQMPIAVRDRKVTGMPVWQVTIRTGAPPAGTVAPDAPWAGREMTIILHTSSGERPPSGRGRRPAGQSATEEAPRLAVLLPRKVVRQWVARLPGAVSVVELRQDGALELIADTGPARFAAGEDASELTVPGRQGGSRRAAQAATDAELAPPPGVVRQRLGDGRYWVAPQAFFQVNNRQTELILDLVRAALPLPGGVLVDAYSGVGAFALALLASGHARQVVAIESDWAAVESARWTAALREVPAASLQLEQGRVEDILPQLDVAPDAVLLDPPRTGCSPALLRYLLAHPVPRLVYISCDPSTLARDIRTLAPGYTLTRAQVVDMFPQTYHIETVAVLEKV